MAVSVLRVRRFAGRVVRGAVRHTRASADAVADVVRRGDRTVVWTPQGGLRGGNFLYLWLRAHARTRSGAPTLVLHAPGMDAWLETFPSLARLTIRREEVRFIDRREWDDEYLYQRYGVDFAATDVDAFVAETLAPHIPLAASDLLVVNVRRGDYYTHFREKYAFDQIGYVVAAIEQLRPIERILVVSDDDLWCRANLDAHLRAVAAEVAYARPEPLPNFLAVAGARRIIGMNSTFSYWGGYCAVAMRPDAQVTMPLFHGRMGDRTDAHQLDPRWTSLAGYH